ncbi:MAG: DUF2148 domain-containing protein [Elusimicrobiota bacterium]
MPIPYRRLKNAALQDVAAHMCVAARTAPKTKGKDFLIITALTKADKNRVIAGMRRTAKREKRPGYARDAGNLKGVDHVVVLGVKSAAAGLDCGFCGRRTCKDLKRARGVCAFNSIDLGIALGSSAALAARFHVDNRLMYSIGKTAMDLGLLGRGVVQAIGIPLAATGKSPFFDRESKKKTKK